MIYTVYLKGVNEYIEEEVIIDINGVEIVGFSSTYPYKIEVEKSYPVELELIFLDSEDFKEIKEEIYSIEKIDNAYSYRLRGKVINGSIDIGSNILIEDEIFKEYAYLNGLFVELVVDRISVNFIN